MSPSSSPEGCDSLWLAFLLCYIIIMCALLSRPACQAYLGLDTDAAQVTIWNGTRLTQSSHAESTHKKVNYQCTKDITQTQQRLESSTITTPSIWVNRRYHWWSLCQCSTCSQNRASKRHTWACYHILLRYGFKACQTCVLVDMQIKKKKKRRRESDVVAGVPVCAYVWVCD